MSNLIKFPLMLTLALVGSVSAYETVMHGIVGATNERPVSVPPLAEDGSTVMDCVEGTQNITAIYVNCVTRQATVHVCTRQVDNFSRRPKVHINDDNVDFCVAEGSVDFINEVCDTNLESADVAAAITRSVATYSYPLNNKSVVCVSAVGQLPEPSDNDVEADVDVDVEAEVEVEAEAEVEAGVNF